MYLDIPKIIYVNSESDDFDEEDDLGNAYLEEEIKLEQKQKTDSRKKLIEDFVNKFKGKKEDGKKLSLNYCRLYYRRRVL